MDSAPIGCSSWPGGPPTNRRRSAARLARDRATIVDIGKCKLDLPWSAYYEKELDLRFSRSYGPGRYDPQYEVQGVDYPAGYVRWTERRNLACFVDLIARGEIDLEPLVAATFPVTDAVDVYERLRPGGAAGRRLSLRVPRPTRRRPGRGPSTCRGDAVDLANVEPRCARSGDDRAPGADVPGPLRVGFIGAGNYANSMLLPHLAGATDVELVRVATLGSLSAVNAQRKFGFATIGTDADAVLADDSIDAVFIVTRHSSHAALACEALEAGKAVFVEKPLALDDAELDAGTGDRRRHRQRPAHGRLQPPVRTHAERDAGALRSRHRAHRGPLPRQRRPAGGGQLVRATRRRGLALRRRGRALHRHA